MSERVALFTPGRLIMALVVMGGFANFVYPMPQMRETAHLEQEARIKAAEEERQRAAIQQDQKRREASKMLAAASTDEVRALVEQCKAKIETLIGATAFTGVTFPRMNRSSMDTFKSIAAISGGTIDVGYLIESDSADPVLDNQARLRRAPYYPTIELIAQYQADSFIGLRTRVVQYSCGLDGYAVREPHEDDIVMSK